MFGDTSSEESLSRAEEWISHCSLSHTSCQRLPPTPLPKRVVAVRSILLVETRNQSGRYICLSHCWGVSRPRCLTTRSTIKDNLGEIAWESLPDTFRDAIQVTKKLDVQFLWIDSICIIQDDNHDREEESSKMASIYQNSYLTLCATSAPSDDAGLWPRAPVDAVKMISIQKSSNNYKVYMREGEDAQAVHLRCSHLIPVREKIKVLCPLMNRAWVFQEQILSPRLLHFSHG
jgi:hypothetical protein